MKPPSWLRQHATAHFGQRELRSIKPSVIQAWIRGLQQKLAPTYVRTIFTNVSTVFTAAVDDGLIATNPCKARSIKLPPREQRKIQPWPVEQVEAVIDALPDRYRATAVVAAGESVKAVAEYLGHADPGFTLGVDAHLFPTSDERARRAVDNAFSRPRAQQANGSNQQALW